MTKEGLICVVEDGLNEISKIMVNCEDAGIYINVTQELDRLKFILKHEKKGVLKLRNSEIKDAREFVRFQLKAIEKLSDGLPYAYQINCLAMELRNLKSRIEEDASSQVECELKNAKNVSRETSMNSKNVFPETTSYCNFKPPVV